MIIVESNYVEKKNRSSKINKLFIYIAPEREIINMIRNIELHSKLDVLF